MNKSAVNIALTFVVVLTLLLVIDLVLPAAAEASWRVVPIRVDLSARSKTGSFKVINEGDTTLRFQLNASLWEQDGDAKDQYAATGDLVFFPRILTVPPGEERMVRTGYKVPAADREKTYRLFIEQIPEKTSTSAAQVSILIRFGVPIFSAPLQPKAAAEIRDIAAAAGNIDFTLDNTGNVNVQIHTLAVKALDKAGQELYTESVKGWYLLSGKQRRHTIPLRNQDCRRTAQAEILIKTDKLDFSRLIELDPERCGE